MTKSQIQKTTKSLDLCDNHLFRLKVKKEKENRQRDDFRPK
jgi:hypothetical protein